MNYYLLTLVSSLPLREQHIIKVKQIIGSHNKYFTLPEHASESRKKKNLFYKVQCQSIIILLKSKSKNISLNLEACPHYVLSYFKGQWKSEKNHI